MVANSFHYPEVLWAEAEVKVISIVSPRRMEEPMSLDLSVGSRRVRGAGLKGDMPDIVQVERKQSGLGFKTLTTRRFQEFKEDLSKLGGEAIGFLCHYGSLSPLLSRSEQGRAVKQFCKTFVSDLLRLGRQTAE